MATEQMAEKSNQNKKSQKIKCVVWDLDHTLWDGILLEDRDVSLKPGVVDIIKELDARGILHSIASRNDQITAEQKLHQFGLYEYFLYPQINWQAKSASLQEIARELNLGLDTFAFIDDQAFEREEVAFTHPEVLCIDTQNIHTLVALLLLCDAFIVDLLTQHGHAMPKIRVSFTIKRSFIHSGSNIMSKFCWYQIMR